MTLSLQLQEKGVNKLRTAEYRIGVVGLLYSGKTVLLTSLIDNLKNHDLENQRRRFRIGDGTVMISKIPGEGC